MNCGLNPVGRLWKGFELVNMYVMFYLLISHSIVTDIPQCIYLFAFLCLLRGDEALKIDMRHVEYRKPPNQMIILTLDFRKTAQAGGMIYLYYYYAV